MAVQCMTHFHQSQPTFTAKIPFTNITHSCKKQKQKKQTTFVQPYMLQNTHDQHGREKYKDTKLAKQNEVARWLYSSTAAPCRHSSFTTGQRLYTAAPYIQPSSTMREINTECRNRSYVDAEILSSQRC